jgi:hypothetical protein
MEIEIREKGELGRCVIRPVRVAFGDCDTVIEVEEKFYGE